MERWAWLVYLEREVQIQARWRADTVNETHCYTLNIFQLPPCLPISPCRRRKDAVYPHRRTFHTELT